MSDLAHLKSLLAEATSRDWEITPDMFGRVPPKDGPIVIHFTDVDLDGDDQPHDYGQDICEMSDTQNDEANARLIVAAVNALPELIERVERLEGALKEIALCERYAAAADSSYEYEMRQIELSRLIQTRAALKGADDAR